MFLKSKLSKKTWKLGTLSGGWPVFGCRTGPASGIRFKDTFFKRFSSFFILREEKRFMKKKKNLKMAKKGFQLALGYAQHPKAGQNTQQSNLVKMLHELYFYN